MQQTLAVRLDRAMLRTLSILQDARNLDLMDDVKRSRYHTNIGDFLAAELRTWGCDPDRGKM